MSTEQMVVGESYQDAQLTTYLVQESDSPSHGALKITVIFRKVSFIYTDAARMADGKFQFAFPGAQFWLQMTFSPISSKVVPPAVPA